MRNYAYVIFIFVFLQISCQSVKKDEWVGKQIVFPKELHELRERTCFPLTNFHKKIIGKKKIVSIIDATCIKCIIGQLNKIDSLLSPLTSEDDVAVMIFVLNVNQADSVNFMMSMYPEIRAKGFLLWDNEYHFETENNILTEKVNRRTFLLDENNKILLVGNPLFHKDLLKYYETNIK